jgi:hypothetical protein
MCHWNHDGNQLWVATFIKNINYGWQLLPKKINYEWQVFPNISTTGGSMKSFELSVRKYVRIKKSS